MNDFEMLMPTTLEQAISALPKERTEPASAQKVRILAGGQDLLVELKDHLAEPDTVVNIKRVGDAVMRELGEGSVSGAPGANGQGLILGALRTVADLERDPKVREHFPALSQAAASIASPQIRTLATIAGNLCQRPRCWYYRNEHTVCLKKGGDECFSYSGLNKYNAILGGGPSYIVHPSDLATAFVSLDAVISTNVRAIPAGEFFTLPAVSDPTRENVLAPNEIIESIFVPLAASATAGWKSTYVKFKERESFDFALSAVALRLRMDGDRIAEARLCLGGVAPIPWRCRSTEQLLVGRALDDKLARDAGEDALRGAEPLGHNAYKIPLTKALIGKALKKLA